MAPFGVLKEVLADGRGVIVPFRDSEAIAKAIIDLWEHPEKKKEIEERAYRFGRLMTWPNVAQRHLNLFRTVLINYQKNFTARESAHTPSDNQPPFDQQKSDQQHVGDTPNA